MSDEGKLSAPQWLRDMVLGNCGHKKLIGVRYVDAESRSRPQTDPEYGFDCWGWVWYYEFLSGLVIPKDAFVAEKFFQPVLDRPRWRDIITYREKLNPVPHCGVMEDQSIMIHCSRTSGGVSRSDILFPPWCVEIVGKRRDNVQVLRHKSLL